MSDDRVDYDVVLDLVSNRHRRILLAVLVNQQRVLTVNDLTKEIATLNHHTPITEITGREIERILRALHHVHIPKLTAKGVVEYDQERGLVKPTGKLDRLQPHLSTFIEADPDLDVPVDD